MTDELLLPRHVAAEVAERNKPRLRHAVLLQMDMRDEFGLVAGTIGVVIHPYFHANIRPLADPVLDTCKAVGWTATGTMADVMVPA